MKNDQEIAHATGRRGVLAGLVLLSLIVLPVVGFAQSTPPPFEFNDRCVPYEVDHDFMEANGVDPTKILTTFGGPIPDDPTAGNAPWTADFEGDGVTPIPCDDFHTHKRRTRYEGCHFYDGTPCYFTTNGQMDQDAFTPDEAGRRAFEIAEHFVIYEVVQQFEPTGMPPNFDYFPAPIFTDPFPGGFAVGTQTKIMNAKGAYFTDNPLGLWRIGFIQFTEKASACRMNYADEDCLFMHDMVAANGISSQNLGYPLIYTGDDIFGLTERGLVSIRYRLGADGLPGGADGPRYILCPVHEAPDQGNIFVQGQDIIQGYPTHIEFQPPTVLLVFQDFSDFPLFRGHIRFSPASPFGPTPPAGTGPFAEQSVYDNFDCLQRTGNWCAAP